MVFIKQEAYSLNEQELENSCNDSFNDSFNNSEMALTATKNGLRFKNDDQLLDFHIASRKYSMDYRGNGMVQNAMETAQFEDAGTVNAKFLPLIEINSSTEDGPALSNDAKGRNRVEDDFEQSPSITDSEEEYELYDSDEEFDLVERQPLILRVSSITTKDRDFNREKELLSEVATNAEFFNCNKCNSLKAQIEFSNHQMAKLKKKPTDSISCRSCNEPARIICCKCSKMLPRTDFQGKSKECRECTLAKDEEEEFRTSYILYRKHLRQWNRQSEELKNYRQDPVNEKMMLERKKKLQHQKQKLMERNEKLFTELEKRIKIRKPVKENAIPRKVKTNKRKKNQTRLAKKKAAKASIRAS